MVIFTPQHANCVGVFNPANSAFSCVDISSTVSGSDMFRSATRASNGLVIMAPSSVDCVGVFDPETNVFSCVDISHTVGSSGGFNGAATATSGLVVFAPYSTDCVGVFDPANNAFSCVDISSAYSNSDLYLHMGARFKGATRANNGLIIFAPHKANCVGIFDPETNAFSCVSLSSTISSTDAEFHGAATASNGLIILAPSQAHCVGVFNPINSSFTCVDVSETVSFSDYNYKFAGATTAENGLVVFSPHNADCVGIFDPMNSDFRCVDITSTVSTASGKFGDPATTSSGLVVFPAYRGNCIGVFDPRLHIPPSPPPPSPSPPPPLPSPLQPGATNYLRFNTIAVWNPNCCVSMGQIIFYSNSGAEIDMSGVVATNPGGSNPVNEGPEKTLIAASLTSNEKWLDFNYGDLVLAFPNTVQVASYSFTNVHANRDRTPVRWMHQMMASVGSRWTVPMRTLHTCFRAWTRAKTARQSSALLDRSRCVSTFLGIEPLDAGPAPH